MKTHRTKNRCLGWVEDRHDTAAPIAVIYTMEDAKLKFCPTCLVDYLNDPDLTEENREIAQTALDASRPFHPQHSPALLDPDTENLIASIENGVVTRM